MDRRTGRPSSPDNSPRDITKILFRAKSQQDLRSPRSAGDGVPTKEELKAKHDELRMLIVDKKVIENQNKFYDPAKKVYAEWQDKLAQRNQVRGEWRQAINNNDPDSLVHAARYIEASTQNLKALKACVNAQRLAVSKYEEFLNEYVSDFYHLNDQMVQPGSRPLFSDNKDTPPMIAEVRKTYAVNGKSLEGVLEQVLERFSERYKELDKAKKIIGEREALYTREEQEHGHHRDEFEHFRQQREGRAHRRGWYPAFLR
jgi:hypothetical protein